VFCFPKSRINENGGKESQTLCYETRCIQLYVKISLTITTKTFPLTILSTKNYNFFIFATEDIPCWNKLSVSILLYLCFYFYQLIMKISMHLPFSASFECIQGDTGAHIVIWAPAHPAYNLLYI